ncbi:zinc ribbon domain-containing protein YjdM [Corynebacterium callunae]|nr:zinc ribbon domain-containing protein YjdM [Corynebacterium callunae]
MSQQLPPCPECASEYTYEDGDLLVCPMCAHEWVESAEAAAPETVIKDAVGNILQEGDSVSIVKSLKVKGGGAIKIGTKVSGIHLLEELVDGHDIEAKVPGFGQLRLKSSVVKKA